MKASRLRKSVLVLCVGLAIAPMSASAFMSPINETVTDRTPTFQWSTGGWQWCQLWINRNGNTYHTQWVNTTGLSLATWTPGFNMPAGNYRWWVRGYSSGRYSGWSSWADFTIVAQIPGTLTLTAPSGFQTATTLAYRWQKDSRATYYELWITKNNVKVFDKWYTGTGTGEMSVTLSGHARGVTWRWWVRGWSPDGYGPWSGPLTFNIDNGAPAKPVTSSPSGTITSTKPVFTWGAASRATWYRVYVLRGSTKVIDKWTQATSLTSPVTLAGGVHTWWVGAWNEASGQTVWSDPRTFTLSLVAQYEASVHTLINNYRTSHGRSALTYDSRIASIARAHSQNMANGTVALGHDGFDARVVQIKTFMSITAWAENVVNTIPYDPNAPQSGVNWWLGSSGHYANLMSSTMTHTGVGAAQAANGRWYFTQIFVKHP